jgi:hypothetical protein
MHECEECGMMCDCDGEDIDQPQPKDHVCINPACGADSSDCDVEDDDPREGHDP